MVEFGGEQSDAHVGAAGFHQRMLLERSIHADAAVTSQTPGVRESRARGGAASWASLAAVAGCGGVRERIFAVRVGWEA